MTVVSGRTYPNVRCEKANSHVLLLTRSKSDGDILGLDSVIAVGREQRGSVVVGVVAGVLVGGLVGGIIAGKSHEGGGGHPDLGGLWAALDGMAIGAVIGGVAGGVIVANLDEEKYFDLSQLTLEEKWALLKDEVINK